MAIVQSDDAGQLIDSLVARGHRVTWINTAGGFLQAEQRHDSRWRRRRSDRRGSGHHQRELPDPGLAESPPSPDRDMADFATLGPVEVQVGGATAWVLAVDQVVRL